jgi:hypothetical protein
MMGRRRSAVGAAAVMLVCARTLSLGAQESGRTTIAGVSAGSRLRIATPDAAPFIATLLRDSADTLVVELPSGSSLALAQPRITRLEVSGGVRHRTWQGAGIGFLAGAGVGTVVALATYRRSDCGNSAIGQKIFCPWLDGVSREATVIVDATLLGAAGTVVGALIGHVGHETWIPVSVARVSGVHGRFEVRGSARSAGIGVGLDF